MDFDPSDVARWAGILVPLIVGVITKKHANSGLKAVANLFVSAVVGSTAYLVAANGGYDLDAFVTHSAEAFFTGIVAYYGFFKPTGIAGSVTERTSGFGLGPEPDLTTEDLGAESVNEPNAFHAAIDSIHVELDGLRANITHLQETKSDRRIRKAE